MAGEHPDSLKAFLLTINPWLHDYPVANSTIAAEAIRAFPHIPVLCFTRSMYRQAQQICGVRFPTAGAHMAILARQVNLEFSAKDIYGLSFKSGAQCDRFAWTHYGGDVWRQIVSPHNINVENTVLREFFGLSA